MPETNSLDTPNSLLPFQIAANGRQIHSSKLSIAWEFCGYSVPKPCLQTCAISGAGCFGVLALVQRFHLAQKWVLLPAIGVDVELEILGGGPCKMSAALAGTCLNTCQ
eukprot:766323-Pelagomonas_calceolata.AAC.2